MKHCKQCGAEFDENEYGFPNMKFCSVDCAVDYYNEHPEEAEKWTKNVKRYENPIRKWVKCGICHKKFFQNRKNSAYCSEACRKKAMSIQRMAWVKRHKGA